MFNRILVVLDATQHQSCVFTIALAYAKVFRSEVLLLHYSPRLGQDQQNFAALSKLRSLQTIATGVGLNVDSAEFNEQTEQDLWQFSKQWNPNLILVDPTDFSDDFDAFQNEIIRNAPCSVLLVQHTSENSNIAMRMILKQKQKYDTESARKQLETLLAMSSN